MTDRASLTLVLGGIRSGKSAIAVKLAADCGDSVTVIATGLRSDPEMEARIAAHQAARPHNWALYEEPLQPDEAIASVRRGTVLVDSIDSWIGNLMHQRESLGVDWELETESGLRPRVEHALARLTEVAASPGLTVIVVSSEVGLGLVATTPQGRAFTDLLGWANQKLALSAERVLLAVAGLACELKPVAETRRQTSSKEGLRP